MIEKKNEMENKETCKYNEKSLLKGLFNCNKAKDEKLIGDC